MHYILKDGEPVFEPDVLAWAAWFEANIDKRAVARDELPGGVVVSTVFLSLDHSFTGGTPVLWETMVFGGPMDAYLDRYRTKEAALEGHAAILEQVRAAS